MIDDILLKEKKIDVFFIEVGRGKKSWGETIKREDILNVALQEDVSFSFREALELILIEKAKKVLTSLNIELYKSKHNKNKYLISAGIRTAGTVEII